MASACHGDQGLEGRGDGDFHGGCGRSGVGPPRSVMKNCAVIAGIWEESVVGGWRGVGFWSCSQWTRGLCAALVTALFSPGVIIIK